MLGVQLQCASEPRPQSNVRLCPRARLSPAMRETEGGFSLCLCVSPRESQPGAVRPSQRQMKKAGAPRWGVPWGLVGRGLSPASLPGSTGALPSGTRAPPPAALLPRLPSVGSAAGRGSMVFGAFPAMSRVSAVSCGSAEALGPSACSGLADPASCRPFTSCGAPLHGRGRVQGSEQGPRSSPAAIVLASSRPAGLPGAGGTSILIQRWGPGRWACKGGGRLCESD